MSAQSLECTLSNLGDVLAASGPWGAYVGCGAEKLPGRNFFNLLHRADVDTTRAWLALDEPPSGFVNRLCTAGGTVRTCVWSGQKTADGDVQLCMLAEIGTPLEGKLQPVVNLGDMFATHETPMLIIDPADVGIVAANASAARMYGCTIAQLCTMNITELDVADASALHQKSVDIIAETVQNFTAIHRMCDGTLRSVEVHVSPFSADGKILLCAILHDVTRSHILAEKLKHSEEKYKLLAQNASSAVFCTTAAGSVTWVSPAVEQLLGYPAKYWLGRDTATTVHPSDLGLLKRNRVDIASGAANTSYELRIRHAGGQYLWFSSRSSPQLNDVGEIVGRVTALRNIDDQVKLRQKLTASETMFRLALQGAPQGMAVLSLDGTFSQTNEALASLVGRSDLVGKAETSLFDPTDVARCLEIRSQLLSGPAEYDMSPALLRTVQGEKMQVLHAVALVRGSEGEPLFYVTQYHDFSEAYAARTALQHRASHDFLTGLPARELLLKTLAQSLGEVETAPPDLVVVFTDLDGFKSVNDTFGHAAGDEVLRTVATRMLAATRAEDVVARIGGDEFVLILKGVHNRATATHVMNKVCTAAQTPILLPSGLSVTPSLSYGVTVAQSGQSVATLLAQADADLSVSKRRRHVERPEV